MLIKLLLEVVLTQLQLLSAAVLLALVFACALKAEEQVLPYAHRVILNGTALQVCAVFVEQAPTDAVLYVTSAPACGVPEPLAAQ